MAFLMFEYYHVMLIFYKKGLATVARYTTKNSIANFSPTLINACYI